MTVSSSPNRSAIRVASDVPARTVPQQVAVRCAGPAARAGGARSSRRREAPRRSPPAAPAAAHRASGRAPRLGPCPRTPSSKASRPAPGEYRNAGRRDTFTPCGAPPVSRSCCWRPGAAAATERTPLPTTSCSRTRTRAGRSTRAASPASSARDTWPGSRPVMGACSWTTPSAPGRSTTRTSAGSAPSAGTTRVESRAACASGHGNAWEISTRACASANRGFGVTASRVLDRTPKSLAVEVDLGDRFTRPRPLMRVRYRYDVEPRALRTEVTVTELCGLGRCGRTRRLAFVKEPKLVVHAGGAFRRVEVLDDRGGSSAKAAPRDRAAGRSSSPSSAPSLRAPPSARRRAAPRASTSRREAGQAARTGSTAGPWTPPHGRPPTRSTRRRSTASCGRATAATRPGRCCGAGSSPGRRGKSIGALLPAWEGGRGGYDCEPLSRLFGPRGSTWRAELDYSLVR